MPGVFRSLISSIADLEDRLTVRQQIGVAAALLCVAVVVAVTLTATYLGHRQAEEQVNKEMMRLATATAERADRYMYLRHREIRLLAEMEALRGAWQANASTVRGVLDRLQATIRDYTWIGFATADGIVKAASGGLLEGSSVASRPWFKSGIHGEATEDVHDALMLTKLLGSNSQGEPFRFVDVARPVWSADGALLGVLGAHFSWTWADD